MKLSSVAMWLVSVCEAGPPSQQGKFCNDVDLMKPPRPSPLVILFAQWATVATATSLLWSSVLDI